MSLPSRRAAVFGLLLTLVAGACTRQTSAGAGVAAASSPKGYAAQFDYLADRFARVYPSFPYKRVDWSAQRSAYRARAVAARSQDEFIAVAREMLEPLHDLHVWFVDPRGDVVPTFRPRFTSNFERGRWERALRDANYVSRSAALGEANVGGYGYVYLGSWKSPIDATGLDLMMSRLRESPGLIIDVRTNAGGNDATALAFVSRFTSRPLVASYVQTRKGAGYDDLESVSARTVNARGPWQYTRPVVIISGRGGFSATESFVAAMRTLPNVTVIGDTTGGASGNPATFPLGNGWQFTVPQWIEYGPDRQPIEGRGVAPHIVIPWSVSFYDRDRDPLIDAAVGILGERNGVYQIAPASGGSTGNNTRDGHERDGKQR